MFSIGLCFADGEREFVVVTTNTNTKLIPSERNDVMKTLRDTRQTLMLVFALGLLRVAYAQGGSFDEVKRLEGPVNSSFRDEVCAISADDLELFLTSNNRPGGQGGWDLWVARRETPNQPFEEARNIVELNTPENEDVPSISADGQELFFVRAAAAFAWVDLYVATRAGAGEPFTGERELTEINTPAKESSPTISANGLELYFHSDRDGVDGLYVAARDEPGAEFDEIRFLQEVGPDEDIDTNFGVVSLSTDGLTFFFTSNDRVGGMGARDIWMATRERTMDDAGFRVPFGEAVNVGFPVNTTGNEVLPTISADWPRRDSTLYFTRAGDIYQATWRVPGQARFLRGECNDDGEVDIADAVCTLNWQFAGTPAPGCVAATNTNGDEAVDLSDAVWLLNFLFVGGPAPVEPFPDCGPGTMAVDAALGCQMRPERC
ncbi:MAG: hypothetical protein CMJ48_11800 [Planctomycetaceae bacterium]|nr:hypothetical protein [Planctomycetaceae bacterium]